MSSGFRHGLQWMTGDARFGVASERVAREVEVSDLVVKGPVIWDGGGRCRAHGEHLERTDLVEG